MPFSLNPSPPTTFPTQTLPASLSSLLDSLTTTLTTTSPEPTDSSAATIGQISQTSQASQHSEKSKTSHTNVATSRTESIPTGTEGPSSASSLLTSAATQPTESHASVPPSPLPSSASSTTFSTSTNTAASAASTTSSIASSILEKQCSGISCSPALKAAIAVPVVVIGLLLLFVCFVFAGRRRKRRRGPTEPTSSGKKWTRHLRLFSFDAEMLLGGRGSNSLLSRSLASSMRSGSDSLRSQPSIRSIEQAAPPYRDAISQAQPPSMGQVAGLGALGAFGRITPDRPNSSATAPPPYRAAVNGTDQARSPTTPTSASNPFIDNDLISPVEGGSPFADPPGERPTLSRGSSRYASVRGDSFSVASTIGDTEEVSSVREAQVAQNVYGRIRNT